MSLQRRQILAAGAGFGAAWMGGAGSLPGGLGTAQAAAPLAGNPSAAAFRFKVGAIEVTALHDGIATRPLDASFVRNAELKDVQAVLAENFLPTDTLNISFTTLLVNNGSKLVLIDTGFADNGGPTNGRTVAQLKSLAIEPSQIDVVLLSHFHGDHLQGARAKDGKLVYPNAEIMAPESEWAFWMDDARMAAAPDAMKGAFAGVHRVLKPNAKDVKRFAWGQEVVTGITAVEASGHTPGHTAFAISSGGKTLIYVADITNTPLLFARNPEWRVMFDMDAEKAVATRKRILDMAATDRIQVSFYHGNFPSTGFIAREGAGYRLVPAPWSSVL
ncbi:MAG: MBL fold metallo-hydrolase [Methylobacterium sp.]|nr:MBL fold metallo-hydrolase [Methylobacterium sp.]MCA3651537.1 MBL fold metallo-hydrolase [Methylobacterium sp.]MCA4924557.1 MBL fold metallo-hydrolase [Methylobacterium sp.]